MRWSFSSRPAASREPGEATLSYADGIAPDGPHRLGRQWTCLHRDFIHQGSVAIADRRTAPDTVDLASAADVVPEPALATLDKIVIQRTTLHGKLEGTGDSGLHWIPVGGIQSSSPSKTLACEITRAIPADAAPSNDPALFYLNSGDVLSGNLRSLDKSGAEFESNIMTASKLPANELDAIQFWGRRPG